MFKARMAYCGPRGIALSTFLGWAPHDQEAALAWQVHESKRCTSCGWHPQESSDQPHTHTQMCPGCAAIDGARKQARDQDIPGLHLRLVHKDVTSCPTCNR